MLSPVRFSGFRFNCAATMIGMFSSLARPLIPAEISEISICRFSWPAPRGRAQQLEIINHDQTTCVLRAQAARLGSQLARIVQARAVIDDRFSPRLVLMPQSQLACRKIAHRPEGAFAYAFREIHPGREQRHALDELLAAHFQAENRDRLLAVHRHVLGDVHRERGLAHARTRGDDDHLRGVQAAGHAIQTSMNPVASPVRPPFCCPEFSDRLDRFHHLVFHRRVAALEAIFADGVNLLLDLIEQALDFVLVLVGAARAFSAGG